MWPVFRTAARPGFRYYSSAPKLSVDLKALAALRKVKEVSISKAREALIATNNDIDKASAWLDKDLAGSGAQKLAKLQGRTTNEGVIAIYVVSSGMDPSSGSRTRAAMIELNCETDFVARNQLLRKLATVIALTAALRADPSSDPVKHPFCHYNISDFGEEHLCEERTMAVNSLESINTHIRNTVAKVGEKITLRRAVALAREVAVPNVGFRLASYVHGGVVDDPRTGGVGSLVDMSLRSSIPPSSLDHESETGKSLETLGRALARQIVGLNPSRIQRTTDSEDPEALNDQEFMMHPTMSGDLVQAALQRWSTEHGLDVRVNNYIRWKVGELDSP